MLTTLYELKGHEEPRGDARPMGAEHGAQAGPYDLAGAPPAGGAEPRRHHAALRAGHRRRPGRHRPRRPAAPARRPEPGHRQARAARRPVAQPLQVAVPARPGLVRPPALPEVPRQLAGLLAEGQDRRLAGVLHQGDGGALLVQHGRDERVVLGGDRRVDRRGRARGQAAHAAPEAARAGDRHVRQAEHPGRSRPGRVPRRPAPLLGAPRARRVRRQEGASSSAATTPPSTSAARCGSTAPTSRWCSAPRRTSSRATP